MNRAHISIALMAASAVIAAAQHNGRPHSLWYRQPAQKWTEALPVGNGRLGAMVFGQIKSERIQLNEDTVWAGEKRDRMNPDAPKAVPEVRRLLMAGKIKEAELLADKALISVPRALPPYQPLGDLALEFTGISEPRDYVRQLDLETGIATVRYRSGDTVYTREVLCSAVQNVLVVHLTADKPGRISFVASLSREEDASSEPYYHDGLALRGQAIARTEKHAGERHAGAKFVALLRALPVGGDMRTQASRLIVDNADSVTLMLVAGTDLRHKDPESVCRVLLNSLKKPYPQMRAEHAADHRNYMGRVDLDLAGPDLSAIPTGERLQRVSKGEADPQLIALYFQFGRYLLLGSSRPGSMAANLQGKWNQDLAPAWDSKYTININTEMNYWPAETCNLAEMHQPLFDLVESMRESGRDTARRMYNARGFVAHHNTDIWGDTVPIDGARWGVWPMGAAWLCLHLWEHYDFSRDREFLSARAYPAMKEAAEFLLDYMVEDAKGQLLTGPSISPENQYRTAEGAVGTLCMAPYMDTEIVSALFGRVIEASRILGIDAGFRDSLEKARRKLPPLKIGKHGQLQEWLEDYDEPEPGHRHMSHLFALHPGNQITARGTPALAKAARTTLERRLAKGGGHTGWSRAWIINFRARLEDGDAALENLTALLAKSTFPNMFDAHPPFQIDGNFGGAAAVAEMLLQSHAGEVSILPALPKAWAEGRARGLRARGGLEVDVAWRGGRATFATLRAKVDGEHAIRAPKGQQIAGVRGAQTKPGADGTVLVSVRAGKEYKVAFR